MSSPGVSSPGAGAPAAGSPQSRKLGIKPQTRVSLVNRPDGWSLADAPAGVDFVGDDEPADVILAFFRAAADVPPAIDGLGERIRPAGGLWIAWPRRAGGHQSDLDGDVLRSMFLPLGLVDNKNAAIDDDWSGLRFVWRLERR